MATPSVRISDGGSGASLVPRLELAREFRADPLGRHSAELARLVSRLRAGAVADKFCLICTKPHAQWVIAQMSGHRGVPPRIADNRVFTSIRDAEWAVFKLRWLQVYGVAIDEDAL